MTARFAMFFGGPLLAIVAFHVARGLPDESPLHPGAARALVLSALFVLVLLGISGKNASEVARLWIFFMPLLALPAAALTLRKRGTPALALAALLQGMNLVLFRVLVDVWRVEALFDELRKVS